MPRVFAIDRIDHVLNRFAVLGHSTLALWVALSLDQLSKEKIKASRPTDDA